MDIENKMKNERVSAAKADDAREGVGSKTECRKSNTDTQHLLSQDRKVQKGECKLTIHIPENHSIYLQNIQFSILQ